jgi:hypothetical protein
MHFRIAIACAVGLAAIVTAAAASETPRAPGAYTSLTTSNAAACARACADDGICMAWAYHHDNQCQLSAVVSAGANPQALAAGFASRAPAHLRPQTPVVHAEAAPAPLSPAAPPVIADTSAVEALSADEPEDDLVLLGGPAEGDLRVGLR